MPAIIHNKISRNTFLKKCIKYGGAFATSGLVYEYSWGARTNKAFHVALLSDTHIKAYQNEQYRGFFPAKNLEQVILQVSKLNPEGLIINGDIARMEGELGDYTAVKKYLELINRDIPVVMTLGNHDNRDNFFDVFTDDQEGKQEVKDKHVLVLERNNLKLIFLDSLMYVNKTPGLLGKGQRVWLEKYLTTSDKKPVFIFVHHTLNDGDTDLLDADKLFDIVIPNNNVKAIFYGHSHIYKITEKENLKLINLPAVGYNFIDSQPVGWVEAKITANSGIFTLHAIGGDINKNGNISELKWR